MLKNTYKLKIGDIVSLKKVYYDDDLSYVFKKGDKGVVTGFDAHLVLVSMRDYGQYRIAVNEQLLEKKIERTNTGRLCIAMDSKQGLKSLTSPKQKPQFIEALLGLVYREGLIAIIIYGNSGLSSGA